MPYLRPSRFRRLIRKQGERIEYEKAIPATDHNPDIENYHHETGKYNLAGRLTKIAGHIYVPTPLASDVRVFLHSQTRAMTTEEFGIVQVGEITIANMPDEVRFVTPDRLWAIQRSEVTREVQKRGEEKLKHERPLAPLRAWSDNGVVVTTYVAGVDFRLVGRGVEWLTTNRPANGQLFSIEYSAVPCYYYLGESERGARPSLGGRFEFERQERGFLPQFGTLTRYHPSQTQAE